MRGLILFPLVVLPLFRISILIWSWLDGPDRVPSLHVFWVVLRWEVRVEMRQPASPMGVGEFSASWEARSTCVPHLT